MKTNFKFTLPMLAIAAAGTFVSCSDEDKLGVTIDPNAGKELVSFSSTGGEAVTRAGFSTTASTTVAVRIKSEDTQTKNPDGSDHTAGSARYTMTYLTGDPDVASSHDDIHNLLNDTHSDLKFQADAVDASGSSIAGTNYFVNRPPHYDENGKYCFTDTVLIAKDFEFPVCYQGLNNAFPILQLKSNFTTKEKSLYSREIWVNAIIVKAKEW